MGRAGGHCAGRAGGGRAAAGAIAGAHGSGLSQGFDYADVIQSIGGVIGTAMFFLFAIASIPATCFCAFIAGTVSRP